MSRPWSGTLKGQPDHRRNQRFTDQHGRPWNGTIELKTGHPTGVLEPTWTKGLTQLAPNGARVRYAIPLYLIPPTSYVVPGPDHGQLLVAYIHWINDLKEAWKEYRSRVRSLEVKFHGEKARPESPSAQTLDLAGQPPMRVELLLAMQAGNRWALGLSPKMPSWAKPLLPTDDTVTLDFPDAEEEGVYADAEDENLSSVFRQAAAAEAGGVSEAERIATLEAALADSEAKRLRAEAEATAAKQRQVVVKPRGRSQQALAQAGKE